MTSDTTTSPTNVNLAAATSAIVSSYLSRNPMPPEEVTAFIETVATAIATVGNIDTHPVRVVEPLCDPAVPVEESVQDDSITCLECGREFRSLRRHLGQTHGLTPEHYRARWGLPSNYPMVSPEYSRRRHAIADEIKARNRRLPTAA